jgi:di/tricarboxylate transporter
MFATLLLGIVGILTMEEQWSGFSNDVVLSVAVLGAVARGVENTGAVEKVFLQLLGRPKHYVTAIMRLLIPAIVLNIGVSNTANMSILVPIIDKWALDIGIPKTAFLMPLSYTLLISGTIAIFATSSNLIAQSLMERADLRPFGTFEIAPVSAAATLACIVCCVFLVPCFFVTKMDDDDDSSEENSGTREKPTAKAK